MKRMIIASTLKYPNGEKVSSVDLDKALTYKYGEDRDKDNDSFTDEEKQKAVNYWVKECC